MEDVYETAGAEIQHRIMVEQLVKPGDAIRHEMTGEKAHLQHMALGIAGEAGEVVDVIKKHCTYNKPLDRVKLVEELGDLEFYLEGLRANLGLTRVEILQANVVKLRARYGYHYTDAKAIARADKCLGEG